MNPYNQKLLICHSSFTVNNINLTGQPNGNYRLEQAGFRNLGFKKARQSKKWVNFTSFVDDSIKDIPLLIIEIKG